jgi:hypothetical protein
MGAGHKNPFTTIVHFVPSGAGLENGRDFGLVVGRGKGLVSGLGGLIA